MRTGFNVEQGSFKCGSLKTTLKTGLPPEGNPGGVGGCSNTVFFGCCTVPYFLFGLGGLCPGTSRLLLLFVCLIWGSDSLFLLPLESTIIKPKYQRRYVLRDKKHIVDPSYCVVRLDRDTLHYVFLD